MISINVEVSNLIDPFIKGFKELNDEYKHFLEIGLEKYLHDQTSKYLYTNTFLHRAEKVNFFKIYYPIKVELNDIVYDFKEIDKTLKKHKFITIIGSAGSGKSTLTKYIFLNAINTSTKVPILIELRSLNDFEGNLEKLIVTKILNTSIEPSEKITRRALKKGGFLFLLDGYDEIYSNNKQKIIKEIESFIDCYSKNNFIITTRPGSGIEGFNRFDSFCVTSLKKEEITGFVDLMVVNQERKDRINNLISDEDNVNYIEYLSNPLLLSMFILAFESHPEIPKKKTAFYRNVFDTLYSKHDGITKNSYLREKKTKLQRENFQEILNLFSFLSYVQGQYSFTFEYFSSAMSNVKKRFENLVIDNEDLIYDLETTISIFIKDGFEYKFPHRSMQEYFAAEFVSKLPHDKKAMAYNNLLFLASNIGSDRSLNIWYLCQELDASSLKESFLIPELKNIQKRLEITESIGLITEFFGILQPSVLLDNEHDDIKTPLGVLKLYRLSSFEGDLLRFTEANDFLEYFNYFQIYECEEIFLEYLKGAGKIDDNSWYENLAKDEKAIKLLIENGFLNVINNFKREISKKIQILEKEIITEMSVIDELLNHL